MNYDFVCPGCLTIKTVESPIDRDVLVPSCPQCLTIMLQQYTPPHIQFKGTGWHKTDKRNP